MPVQADQVYKSKQQILQEILADWRAGMPDINTNPDTVVRLWSETFANTTEGLFLAMQELYADSFIQTAGPIALQRYGQMYGRPQKLGTLSQGQVRFSGSGGEFIASGSQVGALRPLLADTLIFETVDDAVIPNPGQPDAPVGSDSGGSGNLPAGTFEWASTFVTLGGETAIGDASNSVALAAGHKGGVTNLVVGGDGTIARKVYRRKNGGSWQYVGTQNDNTITIFLDNVADADLGGPPPDESTAERVTVNAQSLLTGSAYNVAVGGITEIVNVDADVNSVTNPVAFDEGSDPETVEVFRQELLEWVRAPQSGGPLDLVAWATSIEGVETATVYEGQDPDGFAVQGMNTIRIAGPGGTVPDSDKIAEVQAYVDSKDIAGITIRVAAFFPFTVTVEVTLTLADGYTAGDVEAIVKEAIIAYVDSIPVGGTIYPSGIYHAVFGLTGIVDLSVDDPATGVAAVDTQKLVTTEDDITVN